MRGKTGAAHFEMIIGFVFFIGFVMFLFLFLSPWDNSSLPNSALEGLYDSFLNKVETNLSTVFVKDTSSAGGRGEGQCFFIQLPPDIFEYVTTDSVSLVRELGGESITSQLNVRKLDWDSDSDFFRVAISPEFTGGSDLDCHENNNFKLGSVIEMKVVSYSALLTMRERYYSDYDALKSELKVVGIFDFAIISEGFPDMSMKPSNEISSAVDILAKEYVIKVLRSNGAISNERISIRIW